MVQLRTDHVSDVPVSAEDVILTESDMPMHI